MAEMYCTKVDGVYLYLHIMVLKIATQSASPWGEQKGVELHYKLSKLEDYQIERGNKTQPESYSHLWEVIDLLEVLIQETELNGDTNSHLLKDKVFLAWYKALSRSESKWAEHLIRLFYVKDGNTRNPDSNEIGRKLYNMCAEQVTGSDERFETMPGTRAAPALLNKPRAPAPKAARKSTKYSSERKSPSSGYSEKAASNASSASKQNSSSSKSPHVMMTTAIF